MNSNLKATLIGLVAPMMWSMNVGMAKAVSEQFGRSVGYAILYTIAFIGLMAVYGRPRFHDYSWKYIAFGIPCATMSAFCFVESLAISHDGFQAVQVGMVNYLWPSITIVLAIFFNGQKARWWVALGFLLSIMGIVMVLGGDRGFDLDVFVASVEDNPLCFLLGLCAALSWAAYNSFTRAWAGGKNPVVCIFMINALVFIALASWDGTGGVVSWTGWHGWVSLLLTALSTSAGYACWNYGMMKGNMTILAIVSYMIPVMSALFTSLWVGASLSWGFAKGVGLVVIGSFVCWLATLPKHPARIRGSTFRGMRGTAIDIKARAPSEED